MAQGTSRVASSTLIKGGVLGMLATGASSMCEKPQSVDYILSQLSAIPGCVEYTSLLDSFVENGTFATLPMIERIKPLHVKLQDQKNIIIGKAELAS